MRHLLVVGSLDKHIQNEKGANSSAAPFACDADYPSQALKGAYFLIICGESTNVLARLDLTTTRVASMAHNGKAWLGPDLYPIL